MIFDLLQKSKETKNLIGFNFYGSENGFYCGYILDYNETFVIIQHYSKFGVNDGILVHKISDIQYFEKETGYLKGIQYFINNQNEINSQTFLMNKNSEHLESFSNLFESFIGNKDYLIKFELTSDEIYFGFIEWCDEDNFSVITIDVEGLIDGKAIFKLEDLKLYWIDDQECRKRKILHTINNSKN
ncbi:MAG: hypothetical protein H7321_07685 [Bacteroidia bacterium]|nr:hypothetical protein [Bacteroidia bacterium]